MVENNKEVLKKLIKTRLESILNMDERINESKQKIKDGDVSPFFLKMFGDEITLNVKVGQSLQTTFGMSFYEQVCKILGDSVGYEVELQSKVLGEVNSDISSYLDQLLDDVDYVPNRKEELKKIKNLSIPGQPKEDPDSTVDVWITTPEKKEILIDITTVKPNKKSFRAVKKKILKWTAMRLSQDPNANVNAYMAIPYNPESKDPKNIQYDRFSSYYDRNDILVGQELWKTVSNNTFDINDLIKIFEKIGKEKKLSKNNKNN